MNKTLNHWFATQILPHEAALMRYLHRVWKSSPDIPDLRQETYVRVYENAAKSLPQSPKAFLFATARNLMIDRMRRERIVSIDYTQDVDSLNLSVDELSPERRLSARKELQCLTEAFDQLPETNVALSWLDQEFASYIHGSRGSAVVSSATPAARVARRKVRTGERGDSEDIGLDLSGSVARAVPSPRFWG